MQIEKCKNCKNFRRHYYVTFRGLEKAECGECRARQKTKKECTAFEYEKEQDFEKGINILNLGLDYNRKLKRLLKYFVSLTKQITELREEITSLLKNPLDMKKKEQ
ncbi:MAG: hypothetical protein IJ415_04185 [Clostridia bacterium]|nr:hypothetical protein [Clostridia bacterium]